MSQLGKTFARVRESSRYQLFGAYDKIMLDVRLFLREWIVSSGELLTDSQE